MKQVTKTFQFKLTYVENDVAQMEIIRDFFRNMNIDLDVVAEKANDVEVPDTYDVEERFTHFINMYNKSSERWIPTAIRVFMEYHNAISGFTFCHNPDITIEEVALSKEGYRRMFRVSFMMTDRWITLDYIIHYDDWCWSNYIEIKSGLYDSQHEYYGYYALTYPDKDPNGWYYNYEVLYPKDVFVGYQSYNKSTKDDREFFKALTRAINRKHNKIVSLYKKHNHVI